MVGDRRLVQRCITVRAREVRAPTAVQPAPIELEQRDEVVVPALLAIDKVS